MEDDDQFEDKNRIIIPQEYLLFKKNKCGLGYDNPIKINIFHIPGYSKTRKFMSVGFLKDDFQRHTIDGKLDKVLKLEDRDEK